MPAATDDQVPKPLTYTLMYHFLWCVLFLLSGITLVALFAGSGRGVFMTLVPPMALFVLALIAGIGAFATYVVRVQLMLGELTREDGFRWSSWSSWTVIVLAPVIFALWKLVIEPLSRWGWPGQWPVPVTMTIAVAEVEVVVWWISHLLSVRGLAKGRKLYLATTPPRAMAPIGVAAASS